MPRSHSRSLDISLSPPETFALLVTPSPIRGWQETFEGIRRYAEATGVG